ncbi:hypothetical protein [Nostoc sp. MS1]|uniref:hypothetical protein n=1 Tax=Nostoc sp. MS1 TaxID=2764711 RepID=UPI001CC5D59E|nr:hypothetical protein [Nostoc sp. MS1]
MRGKDFLAPVRIVGIFFSIVHTPNLCNETISRTSRDLVRLDSTNPVVPRWFLFVLIIILFICYESFYSLVAGSGFLSSGAISTI